ncbi:TIGR04255 family protein [Hypericibacter sp.]|uniref:TIGR04255 family protein n=1 Tax=Hypericibacter sp. TaxID=2705401 RepID=UPI003D6D0966
MTGKPHPKFPNPTILEAACEFTFVRDPEPRWSSGELYKALGGEFPEIQPIGNMALQIVIGTVAPPTPPRPLGVPAPAFRFASQAGDRTIQISDTNFICTVSGVYPGWDTLKASILKNWETILPIILPREISKIGLRYINRIKKEAERPKLADWLRPTADLPATLLSSEGHFLARIESTPDSNSLKLVTLANQEPTEDSPNGAIIFDIDRIYNGSTVTDAAVIDSILETLHDDIWDAFWGARTEALEHKLKGGK